MGRRVPSIFFLDLVEINLKRLALLQISCAGKDGHPIHTVFCLSPFQAVVKMVSKVVQLIKKLCLLEVGVALWNSLKFSLNVSERCLSSDITHSWLAKFFTKTL